MLVLVQWFMLAPKVLNILASEHFQYLALLEYSHFSSRVKVYYLNWCGKYAEFVVKFLIINVRDMVTQYIYTEKANRPWNYFQF
jgi:hypothetical protein